jgi:hypothetical protein
MSNLNKNSILYSLGILAVFAVGIVVSPIMASADSNYNFQDPSFYGYGYNTNYPYQGQTYYQSPAPVYVQPAPAPTTIYSNSADSSTKAATTTKTVAKAKSTTDYTLAYVPTSLLNSINGLKPATNVTAPTNTPTLTANALDTGFLPKGVLGWILLLILLLAIVILVRKVFGGRDRYHAAPLKHE